MRSVQGALRLVGGVLEVGTFVHEIACTKAIMIINNHNDNINIIFNNNILIFVCDDFGYLFAHVCSLLNSLYIIFIIYNE